MINKINLKNKGIEIPTNFDRINDFINSISEFISKEKILLEKDINERSLTHKLAEYLQKRFPQYDVDCEYNKMMKDEEVITKRLNLEIEDIKSNDVQQITVYPDIIIHKRLDNSNNLIVIEVKKKSNNLRKDFDFKKLKAFTKELEYKWGIYLEFDKSNVSDILFFKEGEAIKNEKAENKI